MLHKKKNNEGFTLLEVILILILISIFAAVAVIRQPSTDLTLQAQNEVLKAHIRYAQNRAMNTNEIWGLDFDTENAVYRLFKQAPGTANWRLLPGEADMAVDLSIKGIVIGLDASTLSFDTWGRPYSDNTLITSGPFLISLSKNGQTQSLSLTRNTGFIQ